MKQYSVSDKLESALEWTGAFWRRYGEACSRGNKTRESVQCTPRLSDGIKHQGGSVRYPGSRLLAYCIVLRFKSVESMRATSILSNLPATAASEAFADLLKTPSLRIERIVSRGHRSPASGWYDQTEHEWVMVVAGAGRIQFESGEEVQLNAGEYVNIPAGCRHRVSWTDPEVATVWLAVFYGDD